MALSRNQKSAELPCIRPDWHEQQPQGSQGTREIASDRRTVAVLVLVLALAYLSWCNPSTFTVPLQDYTRLASVAPPLPGLPEAVQRRWGQYSPWFPAAKYVPPPSNCNITQVNILQRHGARYPNRGDDYDKSVQKIQSAKEFKAKVLDFLRSYHYDLGEEALVPFGAEQSVDAGETARRRYAQLVTSPPFVRATDYPRVADTASNWTKGFGFPVHTVIQTEKYNTTLNNKCPNASKGTEHKNTWLATFTPPIAERLNGVAPGVNLTNQDVFNLMAMCPFESVAREKPGPFCKLFSQHEFSEFEYYADVEKYYETGYGNPLGPIQGVGYVNELLARLTDSPVHDKTEHNSSYPFPLHKPFYADFTHENLMVAVYATMGLFPISKPLDPKKMEPHREWIASRMVPFSARMVVERLACGNESEAAVRVMVNDAVQPLEFCGAGVDGVCQLDAFVESQEYARRNGDGDFEKCFN